MTMGISVESSSDSNQPSIEFRGMEETPLNSATNERNFNATTDIVEETPIHIINPGSSDISDTENDQPSTARVEIAPGAMMNDNTKDVQLTRKDIQQFKNYTH